jgi:hypothetical protein
MKVVKPKWRDEDAVHQWVCAQLDLEAEYEHAMRYDGSCDVPGLSVREFLKGIQDQAIRDAKEANNFDLLNSLARPTPLSAIFLNAGIHPLPVGSEALTLLADAATGKFKARKGRPGRSTQQKEGDRILMAIEELPRIKRFLQSEFQGAKGIWDRAVRIAAVHAGIEAGTLRNRLRKSPGKKGKKAKKAKKAPP